MYAGIHRARAVNSAGEERVDVEALKVRRKGSRGLVEADGRSEEVERVKGFEPSTPSMASWCSSAELHPLDTSHGCGRLVRRGGFEPPSAEADQDLNLARLPIPPPSPGRNPAGAARRQRSLWY